MTTSEVDETVSPQSIIEVHNLSKIFGKDPRKAVDMLNRGHSKEEVMRETGQTIGVNRASFAVQEGEAFVIMGLSGSGKSTLIRCLNRLIEPTSGSVKFRGEEVTALDKHQLRDLRRKSISMVFQSFAIFPHRTVVENVAYGLKVNGMGKQERLAKAAEALALVGLKGWEDQLPSQLSGGMQQRVGLARALATDAEVLLMDEAFSALDPLIRKDMQLELVELQRQMKKTIIFITHDLDEALKIGDRIALMRDGEIVQIGTPEQILMNPETQYVKQFVEDVDRSLILTADMIMRRSTALVTYPKDGPRVALRRMQSNDISSIFVTDYKKSLIGIVMAEDALKAVEQGETNLDNIIKKDIPTVLPNTPLKDMFNLLTGKNMPLAVVDETGRFKGIIVRGTVMAKLAEGGSSDA